MKNNNESIGFSGALLILFIALKLTNVIDWSWWWVMSPLWLPVVVASMLFVVYLLTKK